MAKQRPKKTAGRGIIPQAVGAVLKQMGTQYGKGRAGRTRALLDGGRAVQRQAVATGVAESLGVGLYTVDLSRAVSRYIGETEKNLDAALDLAEASHAILYIDEAEALFGKRSEVKDAHDRFAHIEVAYLRKRVGAFKGLLILATDRRESIDPAFLRRVDVSVPLPPPRGKKKNQRESSPRPVTRPRDRR